MNLLPEEEQVCNIGGDQFDDAFSGNLPQVCSFTGDSNGLGPFGGGLVYSSNSSIGSELGTSQVCSFGRRSNDSGPHVHKEQEQACYPVVEINSSSSVEVVKEEFEEECSRKR